MKPWSGLAAMMLLLSMALFAASMASSSWLVNETAGLQKYHGPFEACVRDWKNQIHECSRVWNDCVVNWSAPLQADTVGSSCVKTRVVRAFSILGIIFAAFAFIPAWLGYNSFDDIMYRLPALIFSLLSGLCGMIAWAVWTSMSQHDYSDQWRYGWGEGCALGAWLIPLAAAVVCLIPSPLRDMSTGKLIARDSLSGRGGYADMFKLDWWTRGSDWGGRERALRGGPGGYAGRSTETGGMAGAPGSYDAERGRGVPGTAYRDEPLTSPRRSPRQFGASGYPKETQPIRGEREERMYGTSNVPGETESERLSRERQRGSSMTSDPRLQEPTMMEKIAEKISGTPHTQHTTERTAVV